MKTVQEINSSVEQVFPLIKDAYKEIEKVIVGKVNIIDKLFLGLFGNGHILLEGVPGLAKTTAIKAVSEVMDTSFGRIQFTPDLLPADLIGTQIYSQKSENFHIKKGPLFSNLILADEINRAPAKVQSALLEAMQEKTVTIGEETLKLPSPFMVLATQNPVEQDGTYPLPEAQLDRFMLKVNIGYPTLDEEIEIVKRQTSVESKTTSINALLDEKKVLEIRDLAKEIYVDEKLYQYCVEIVHATRYPHKYKVDNFLNLIEYGAGPRASIYLIQAAKTNALLNGRGYTTPQDVKTVAYDVLRHRVLMNYEAEAQELTSENLISEVLNKIEVP